MALLGELTIGEIVSRLAAALIYAGLQGFLLAAIARIFGDKRPTYDGRLTPNPITHLSVWGAAMAALFAVSWIRPMRVSAEQNRLGRPGLVLVAALSLAAMLALIPLLDLLRPVALMLPRTAGYSVLYVLGQLQVLTLGAVLLNLLPVPGLIGGVLWQAIWPEQERRLMRWEPIALAAVIAGLVSGLIPEVGPALLPYLRLL